MSRLLVSLAIVLVILATVGACEFGAVKRANKKPDIRALAVAIAVALSVATATAASWDKFAGASYTQLAMAGAAGLLVGLTTWAQLRVRFQPLAEKGATTQSSLAPDSSTAQALGAQKSRDTESGTTGPPTAPVRVEGIATGSGDVRIRGRYVAGRDMSVNAPGDSGEDARDGHGR